jgi:hypothetical protein
MGVDKDGNLWAWNGDEANVTVISPGGKRQTYDVDTDIKELDVDAERGMAILQSDGTSVAIVPFASENITKFRLSATANAIAWLDGDQVAVAPERTGSLVEIWSASTRNRIRTVGEVPPITIPARGAVLTRASLIHYDRKRDELTVLDAFYGTLSVFDAEGKIVRKGVITHPRLGPNIVWLQELDANAKAQGDSSAPTMYNYARMSVSQDGSIWLGEDGPTPDSITVAKLLPNGKVERKPISVPECASVRYVLWQDQLIFFRVPRSPRKQCTTTKEVSR